MRARCFSLTEVADTVISSDEIELHLVGIGSRLHSVRKQVEHSAGYDCGCRTTRASMTFAIRRCISGTAGSCWSHGPTGTNRKLSSENVQ